MIHRLRRKLIATSMLSLLLVLTVVMGALNILNYRGIVAQADATLALLAEGGGNFPPTFPAAAPERPSEPPHRPHQQHISPELPFMSRYFSVTFAPDSSVTATDTTRIAAVDTNTAVEMAQRIRANGRTHGFVRDYRCLTTPAPEGGTRVIFLDCTRELSTCRSFLWGSIAVSVGGLLAVFVLILLVSGRVIRPVTESYAKQRRFITDAGHELKTPLTIINADAELLEMEVGEDNEWLRDIRQQTARLSRLTADLIYLSKLDEARADLQMIEFPFSDVVTETAQSFAALALTQHKRFTLDIAPMLTLCGDEKSIRQLVSVLLDNALKYAPDGGEIILTASRQPRSLLLTVANTAQPIDGEHLPRLFDRFYRVDRARDGSGYGLGLSIARAVVNAHRGRISAAYADGRLTVTVTLP